MKNKYCTPTLIAVEVELNQLVCISQNEEEDFGINSLIGAEQTWGDEEDEDWKRK